MFALAACGGSQTGGPENGSGPDGETPSGGEADGNGEGEDGGESGEGGSDVQGDEFQLNDSDDADQARGEHPSEIESTRTHAAMRLFVVDRDSGPIEGVVIKLTAPEGQSYYTDETDAQGYGEVLVPVGQRYQIEYLSLGRRNTMAHVDVPEGPRQDIRLTMRYRRIRPAPPVRNPSPAAPELVEPPPRFVLEGINFETGSARIQAESFPRLDRVVEYMTHMDSSRIRISGHTDNVGNPQANQRLSESRAQAVRAYLVEHGIDGGRIEAVGHGDTRPIASNDTDAGRAQNRRIEADEL
jgi:outer membrane protein OmpA-like peptidoglycan-associated protein